MVSKAFFRSRNITPFKRDLSIFLIRSFVSSNAPINVMPAGGGVGRGRTWGGDFIVFVGPGVGHLTDLVLPGYLDLSSLDV